MKTGLLIAAAALQLLVLAYMAGEREVVLHTGRTIYLRTAPIDPQDLFRGDYVTLSYEISRVSRDLARGTLPEIAKTKMDKWPKDLKVYTALKQNPDGLAEVLYITDREPAEDLFIRGRLESSWRPAFQVRYGIEAFFVEQGKGLDLERGRRQGDIQIPLEMEVKLAGNGLAVLKGYRWSPLGIGLTLAFDKERRATGATILLLNSSDQDLAIVDLPGGGSFTLDADTAWIEEEKSWHWVGAEAPRPTVSGYVRVLKPGESYPFKFDFSNPAWLVVKPGEKAKPISQLTEWQPRFRLVYRPPTAEETRGLPNAELIWHGEMPSRAFNGGRVD